VEELKHDGIASLVRNVANDIKLSPKFDIEGFPLFIFVLFYFILFLFVYINFTIVHKGTDNQIYVVHLSNIFAPANAPPERYGVRARVSFRCVACVRVHEHAG
jgi:hypothetical protein